MNQPTGRGQQQERRRAGYGEAAIVMDAVEHANLRLRGALAALPYPACGVSFSYFYFSAIPQG